MARGKLKKIGKNVTVWQDCLVVKEDAPVGGLWRFGCSPFSMHLFRRIFLSRIAETSPGCGPQSSNVLNDLRRISKTLYWYFC